MHTTQTAPAPATPSVHITQRYRRRVSKAFRTSAFGILSSTSDAGFAHAAGVVHVVVGGRVYVHTMRSSRKARNIAANPRVAMVVPVRKLPVGPPFTIQFQATAQLRSMDEPHIVELIEHGRLKAIAGHGALDEPDGCFIEIEPNGTMHTYGFGVSPIALMRDPLHVGAGSVTVAELDLAAAQ